MRAAAAMNRSLAATFDDALLVEFHIGDWSDRTHAGPGQEEPRPPEQPGKEITKMGTESVVNGEAEGTAISPRVSVA